MSTSISRKPILGKKKKLERTPFEEAIDEMLREIENAPDNAAEPFQLSFPFVKPKLDID